MPSPADQMPGHVLQGCDGRIQQARHQPCKLPNYVGGVGVLVLLRLLHLWHHPGRQRCGGQWKDLMDAGEPPRLANRFLRI